MRALGTARTSVLSASKSRFASINSCWPRWHSTQLLQAGNEARSYSAGPIGPGLQEKQLKPIGTAIKGHSGRQYIITEVLQDRRDRYVYLARDASPEAKRYVLKSLVDSEYHHALAIQHKFYDSPYLRSFRDLIPWEKMFVYEYLDDHLLNFAWNDLTLQTKKRILRDALRGIAALHAKDIVHLDIKANNIMLDYHEDQGNFVVDRVQLSDLEDATRIPPGMTLSGVQVGNHMWRSPEAHVESYIGKPTDIFSFAIVCIFLLLRRVVLWVDKPAGQELILGTLEQQIRYFAEWDDYGAFMDYLGKKNLWVPVLARLGDSFGEENPRRPFSLWKSDVLDAEFKDLVVQMTKFDPRRRLTAQQALEHSWFRDVEEP